MSNTEKFILWLVSVIIFLSGAFLINSESAKIMIGVLMMMWGNNVLLLNFAKFEDQDKQLPQ